MIERNETYDILFTSLKNDKDLNWMPWVGKNYEGQSGKRLLIVGESHYRGEGTEQTLEERNKQADHLMLTISMIHSNGVWGRGKGKTLHRFLRNTEKVLFNRSDLNSANSQMLWHSVSFYNFIQRALPSQNHRPTQKDWETGWNSFFKLIDVIKPDYVLFCGVSAFQKFYFNHAVKQNGFNWIKGMKVTDKKISKVSVRTKCIIAKDNYNVNISCMRHPSMITKIAEWSKVLFEQMPEYINWLQDQIKTSKSDIFIEKLETITPLAP